MSLNLAYRKFTRIGLATVPDAKTLARIAQAVGSAAIERLHRQLVEMAREQGVIQERKTRVHIHYPTDSKLLGDGA